MSKIANQKSKSASSFEIGYCKPPFINLAKLESLYQPNSTIDKENRYNPFLVKNVQRYQPIFSLFFDMNELNYNQVQFNHRYHMIDMNTVFDIDQNTHTQKNIFIKYSPLFDPIKFLIGKYNINSPVFTGSSDQSDLPIISPFFPSLTSESSDPLTQKLTSTNNASYIDGFFCFLSSKLLHNYQFKNGLDYYGSYLGIQDKYKMNVADDFEYLKNHSFFVNSEKKLYEITNPNLMSYIFNDNSRANKHKLNLSLTNLSNCIDIELLDDIVDLSSCPAESISSNCFEKVEEVYERTSKTGVMESDDASSDSDNNYSTDDEDNGREDKNEFGDEDDEEEEDGEDEESDDGAQATQSDNEECDEDQDVFVYINQFPVQMICLEKCNGTLDELFENEEIDEKRGASALFQIVMTLIAYQKAFSFTHNDLHTNNVMYINTTEPFLYYKFNNKLYKVPTYGKIFKIIDFGRSIYQFKGKTFCSDSFAPGGDAATQYNFEPYYNPKKPLHNPNPSFDLCRLGTSIFDFLFDIDDPNYTKNMDELQKTILRWCCDDMGKNVLYKRNGEERYPNFKLYKMIARNVTKHTPQSQLNYSFFQQFLYKTKSVPKEYMNLDTIPEYSVK